MAQSWGAPFRGPSYPAPRCRIRVRGCAARVEVTTEYPRGNIGSAPGACGCSEGKRFDPRAYSPAELARIEEACLLVMDPERARASPGKAAEVLPPPPDVHGMTGRGLPPDWCTRSPAA